MDGCHFTAHSQSKWQALAALALVYRGHLLQTTSRAATQQNVARAKMGTGAFSPLRCPLCSPRAAVDENISSSGDNPQTSKVLTTADPAGPPRQGWILPRAISGRRTPHTSTPQYEVCSTHSSLCLQVARPCLPPSLTPAACAFLTCKDSVLVCTPDLVLTTPA